MEFLWVFISENLFLMFEHFLVVASDCDYRPISKGLRLGGMTHKSRGMFSSQEKQSFPYPS
jgi:hypothetical protein